MNYGDQPKRKPNPRETANIFSKILLIFVLKLYKKGFSKDLEEPDLYEVVPYLKSKEITDVLEKEWKKHNTNKKSTSLIKVLWFCYGIKLLLFGLLDFSVKTLTGIIRPYALSKLLVYFQEDQTEYTKQDAYFFATLMITSQIIQQVFEVNFDILMMEFGVKIRTAICSLLYRKALKLNPSHLGDVSIGKLITLITKDVGVFEKYIKCGNNIWTSVVKTIVVSYLLFDKIGIASFVGVSILIVILPFQFYIGAKMTALKLKICKQSDDRLQITQETLSAIRIIKMYTWEKIFSKKISNSRSKEVDLDYKLFFLRFTAIELGALNAHIALFLMLMTYLWQGHYLTADVVYFVVDHFQSLDVTLSIVFPAAIYGASEIRAALQRISIVLKSREIQVDITEPNKIVPKIVFKNVTFILNNQTILKGININLKQGLTVITGAIGSGKSTFLKTVLSEYQPQVGSVKVYGNLSYASQEPWLFPSTIKQNIIFGEELNENRYQQVLKVCALTYDFELLEAGDSTIVEDRGINLSKGQQIRINLARAVYRNCDIYLLDDCLATLDANVSSYIFRECIQEFLKNKLVVFTTHNNKYINKATQWLNLVNGQINYDESKKIIEKNSRSDDLATEKTETNKFVNNKVNADENTELLREDVVEKKVYQETKKIGSVDIKVYAKYIQLGGGFILFILVFCTFGLSQYLQSTSDKILSDWVNIEEKLLNISLTTNLTQEYENEARKRESQYKIYCAVTVSLALSYFVRAYAMFFFARRACLRLHKKMINCIINCTMQYFDNNFIGNILNRFSKDLNSVDEVIPYVFYHSAQVAFSIIGTTIMIIIVNTDFLLPALIFGIIVVIIRYVIIRTSRSLKRLDAATRAPVVGYLNATLEGLTTIRAFKVQKILQNEFDRHLDLYTSTYYTLVCSIRGLTVIIDACCDLFIVVIILKFFFGDEALAGTVGLAITQSIRLASHLEWGIDQWAEIENQMTAVERVLEFTTVKQENNQGLEIDNWPRNGEVIYENVSLSYTGSENYVLKNLSFQIKPMEKIGIVGRTGAGKSSIIASLFRLYEVEGKILIDGIDTKTVSLNFLRKNISIIPQDPVLFTGTIRENIDPMNNYTDEEVWNAIKTVNLQPLITSLNHNITDCGLKFSVGQRQLICLARAIVYNNKIIVFDEVTANMDQESDELICKTIKNKFNHCTVFTIAHKLQTLVNADRIMVLSKGQIVEFDSLDNLLQNPNGIFFQMARKDGLSSYLNTIKCND